jgi:hypothetical protein
MDAFDQYLREEVVCIRTLLEAYPDGCVAKREWP